MKDRILSNPCAFAALVVSTLLVVGVLTFAGPCVHEDGSHAACYESYQMLLMGGFAVVLMLVVALLAKQPAVSGLFSAAATCCGIFVCLVPGTLFGLCMMQTMRCWTVMRPFALVCGVVLCACAGVAAVLQLRKAARKTHADASRGTAEPRRGER